MGEIPAVLYERAGVDLTIEPYLGAGASGDVYGPPIAARAIVDARTRSVRSPTGDVVIAGATIYLPLSTVIPVGSIVTRGDEKTLVLSQHRHDGGSLPVPSHLEVLLE